MKKSRVSGQRHFVPAFLASLLRRAFGASDEALRRPAKAARQDRDTLQRRFMLEPLEPRLLLSADPIVSNLGQAYSVAFGSADDVVSIQRVAQAGGGGLIVDLTWRDDNAAEKTLRLGTDAAGLTSLTLDTGAGNDRITSDVLGMPLAIHGGAGNDTFVGPDNAPGNNAAGGTTWSISSMYAGSASGVAIFDGIENLTAGNRSDTLDYSAYAPGVSVNLAADPDYGTATGFTRIKGFENVVGSAEIGRASCRERVYSSV